MEDIQNLLFAVLKRSEIAEVKRILLENPELTNKKRTDDFGQEVTTPLIVAWYFYVCVVFHSYSLPRSVAWA